ncbi:MAG: hypothetical protein PHC52_12925, partial [Syntrophales bacterium]|nr:hypothetical protein [Syntrophales bacterium]
PASLGTIERLLADIAKSTATIAFQLTRIADKQTGISISSTTPPPPFSGQSSPPPPPPERKTENGIKIGDKVRWEKDQSVGQVTRILPGKKDIEVQFLAGRKTLLISQVSKVEAAG